MRRSRRSLSLLLVIMAASLAVVRATTQPTIETDRMGAAENSPKSIASLSPLPLVRPVPKDQEKRGLVAGAKPQLRRGSTVRATGGVHGMTARTTRRFPPRMAEGRARHRRLGRGQHDADAGQCVSATRRPSRPVSATAVIVVIPDKGEPAEPRVGWSGCDAYAVGCDHLGRSVPDRKDDAMIGALIAPRF